MPLEFLRRQENWLDTKEGTEPHKDLFAQVRTPKQARKEARKASRVDTEQIKQASHNEGKALSPVSPAAISSQHLTEPVNQSATNSPEPPLFADCSDPELLANVCEQLNVANEHNMADNENANSTRGVAYQESVKRDLREIIKKKAALNKQMVS